MPAQKLAFIVAGNGFGHLKRVSEVALAIYKQQPDSIIEIFGASAHQLMLEKWHVFHRFSSYSFRFTNAQTEKNLIANVSADYTFKAYQDSLTSIHDQVAWFNPNRVVSDNLVGVLNFFPQAILMGSFLFTDTIQVKTDAIQKIISFEMELLHRIKPVMVGVADMAMPGVVQHTQFKGLPWFCEREKSTPRLTGSRKRVLLAGGGTLSATKLLTNLYKQLQQYDVEVFLDGALLAHAGRGIRFDFSPASFSTLDWIICRPGLGILTDAVTYGIPVFAVYEQDHEMKHNAIRVEQLGLGFDSQNHPADFLFEALFMDTTSIRHNLLSRPVHGATEAASYILNS